MSTWSEIVKHLSPEQIRELEYQALRSPILATLMNRADITKEEPVKILALACIEMAKHANKMQKLATDTIALSPVPSIFIGELV